MTDLPKFQLERVFNAPRALVWRAWTDPAILNRWYGPGAETVIHNFDLQPGGTWLNEMRWGENSNYQKVVFTEVDEPSRLVWNHHSNTDADWNDMANPMMADWPRLLLTTVEFEEQLDGTLVRLTQVPLEATEAEIAIFGQAMGNMEGGWGKGYDMLDGILEELAA